MTGQDNDALTEREGLTRKASQERQVRVAGELGLNCPRGAGSRPGCLRGRDLSPSRSVSAPTSLILRLLALAGWRINVAPYSGGTIVIANRGLRTVIRTGPTEADVSVAVFVAALDPDGPRVYRGCTTFGCDLGFGGTEEEMVNTWRVCPSCGGELAEITEG